MASPHQGVRVLPSASPLRCVSLGSSEAPRWPSCPLTAQGLGWLEERRAAGQPAVRHLLAASSQADIVTAGQGRAWLCSNNGPSGFLLKEQGLGTVHFKRGQRSVPPLWEECFSSALGLVSRLPHVRFARTRVTFSVERRRAGQSPSVRCERRVRPPSACRVSFLLGLWERSFVMS